jgi:hypothetical protein
MSKETTEQKLARLDGLRKAAIADTSNDIAETLSKIEWEYVAQLDADYPALAARIRELEARLSLICDLTVDGDGMKPEELIKEVHDIATNGVPKEAQP